MDRKQLKRTLTSLNLALVDAENGTGNSIDIKVKAPDGAVHKFQVSRLDDPMSDKMNINQMRHFARDHQCSDTLPGIIELDILNVTPKRTTDIEIASRAVADAHSPEFLHYVANAMSDSGAPIDINNMLVAAASTPEDPIPASIRTIEAVVIQKPRKSQVTKPSLTLTKPVMTKTETPKPKRTQERIGQVEFFKLCNMLNEMDMVGISSFPKLAEKLTKAYGKRVAVSTAEDAIKATGKKLDKVVIDATDAQMVIARTLTALLIKLSEPVPDELRKLCGEIE